MNILVVGLLIVGAVWGSYLYAEVVQDSLNREEDEKFLTETLQSLSRDPRVSKVKLKAKKKASKKKSKSSKK